jgi:hypothetical protein
VKRWVELGPNRVPFCLLRPVPCAIALGDGVRRCIWVDIWCAPAFEPNPGGSPRIVHAQEFTVDGA